MLRHPTSVNDGSRRTLVHLPIPTTRGNRHESSYVVERELGIVPDAVDDHGGVRGGSRSAPLLCGRGGGGGAPAAAGRGHRRRPVAGICLDRWILELGRQSA